MDPGVVDCRSLIDFCRSFKKRHISSHPLSSHHHSSLAALDSLLLLSALLALAALTLPSFLLQALPAALRLLPHALPLAYAFALLLLVLALWELLRHHSRKCGSPYCRGLRKAVEFDIQLESEECVRCLRPAPEDIFGARPLELGRDHKELEAELKKMAPPNGRTVLIFRAPCGCPAGRMEVWGPKSSVVPDIL